MQALVTGANGCLGSHLVRELLKSGVRVRAMVRAESDLRALEGLGVETVVGDVRDRNSLDRATQGCEQVYHAAAITSTWSGRAEELFAVNVGGTENVIASCRHSGVKRLIYTSTAAVLGFSHDEAATLDEDSPFSLDARRFPYQASKFQAEERIRAAVSGGLNAVILNPTLMFGAWDHAQHSIGLLRMAKKGQLLVYPPGGIAAVAAEDVAMAHLMAARQGRRGERYVISGENLPFRDLFRIIRRVAGGPGTWIPLPARVLTRAASLLERLSAVTHQEPLLTASRVEVLTSYQYVSDHKARVELHHEPRLVAEGVKAAADWLTAQNGW